MITPITTKKKVVRSNYNATFMLIDNQPHLVIDEVACHYPMTEDLASNIEYLCSTPNNPKPIDPYIKHIASKEILIRDLDMISKFWTYGYNGLKVPLKRKNPITIDYANLNSKLHRNLTKLISKHPNYANASIIANVKING